MAELQFSSLSEVQQKNRNVTDVIKAIAQSQFWPSLNLIEFDGFVEQKQLGRKTARGTPAGRRHE